jgi:hypothetical protein
MSGRSPIFPAAVAAAVASPLKRHTTSWLDACFAPAEAQQQHDMAAALAASLQRSIASSPSYVRGSAKRLCCRTGGISPTTPPQLEELLVALLRQPGSKVRRYAAGSIPLVAWVRCSSAAAAAPACPPRMQHLPQG